MMDVSASACCTSCGRSSQTDSLQLPVRPPPLITAILVGREEQRPSCPSYSSRGPFTIYVPGARPHIRCENEKQRYALEASSLGQELEHPPQVLRSKERQLSL